ncbi:hypothetical protein MOQ_004606 [Trypanosoma cruzi marinkellei]|uniref:AAA+ ATPase domain-containing protein n=1 Tax=Trypanosoma cruzi marinkellei TaxID=85056 RepID=K2N9M7_TRYCR|nr:hypothetical protein MOQ_004606 [Trypanosoma cruzi marinkellei]
MTSTANGEAATRWLRHAAECLYKNDPGCDDGGEVRYTDLLDFMQSAPPPPTSLHAMWEQCVWRLQDEPAALYFLRCLANSLRGGVYSDASFLLDARASLPFPCVSQEDAGGAEAESGLQRLVARIVALRLVPSTTDIIQLGWSVAVAGPETTAVASSSLRPMYCTRTHVVIQLASGRHLSAWAYGGVGLRLRVGTVFCALLYPSRTENQEMAYVIHNVSEITAADDSVGSLTWSRSIRRDNFASYSSMPGKFFFEQLVESFSPEMAGQKLCKSLLLLVVVHTMYRAVRCRARRPLHMLLLGASRSGKSALLRAFLHLLGPHATLVGAHVVHGQQRSAAISQAITATYPHVRQQLLLGGAVSTFDALVIDEVSSRGCANLVEGFITGVCPIFSGGGGVSATMIRSHVMPTHVQVTAAANDDLLAAAALIPQFSVVARTTAQLSLHNAASIGEGVIAASVASSHSSSRTPSRSASLCEPSPGQSDSGVFCAGPLCEDLLRAAVEGAPPASVLEGMIPAEAFTSFYLSRLREHWHGTNALGTTTVTNSTPPLALVLSVLWELNLARLVLEHSCCHGEMATGWNELLAEEVWQCYTHHLWAVETATVASAGERIKKQIIPCGADFSTVRGGKKRKISKKAVCVALLRMMAHEQRETGADSVSEASTKAFFQQLGGEAMTGQTFSDVIQQLLDAAMIIQRLGAYAVVAEA